MELALALSLQDQDTENIDDDDDDDDEDDVDLEDDTDGPLPEDLDDSIMQESGQLIGRHFNKDIMLKMYDMCLYIC